jgi:hypothetical protein
MQYECTNNAYLPIQLQFGICFRFNINTTGKQYQSVLDAEYQLRGVDTYKINHFKYELSFNGDDHFK